MAENDNQDVAEGAADEKVKVRVKEALHINCGHSAPCRGIRIGAYTFLSGDDKAAGEGEQVITEESVEADKDAKDGDAKEGEAKEGESKMRNLVMKKTNEKGKEDEIPKYDSKKELVLERHINLNLLVST